MSDYDYLGDYEIKADTDMAIAVDLGDGLQWLPRSVVEDGNIMREGEMCPISVKEWFLIKEGLV